MKSKVVNCIALFSESELCFCSISNYKICSKRIKDNLNCIESIVRITPIDRLNSDIKDSVYLSIAKNTDSSLTKLIDNFQTTLNHLGRIKK